MPVFIAQRFVFLKWDGAVFQESQFEVAIGEIGEEAEVGEGGGGEGGERERNAVVWE